MKRLIRRRFSCSVPNTWTMDFNSKYHSWTIISLPFATLITMLTIAIVKPLRNTWHFVWIFDSSITGYESSLTNREWIRNWFLFPSRFSSAFRSLVLHIAWTVLGSRRTMCTVGFKSTAKQIHFHRPSICPSISPKLPVVRERYNNSYTSNRIRRRSI